MIGETDSKVAMHLQMSLIVDWRWNVKNIFWKKKMGRKKKSNEKEREREKREYFRNSVQKGRGINQKIKEKEKEKAKERKKLLKNGQG